jgi:hypothetical protein
MMGAHRTAPALTQRLQVYDRCLVVSLDNLRALKPALVRLYTGLSVQQRTTADRLLAHDMGMMPGMPMAGMPMNGMTKN